ncbi:heterokaryon incompatibility protein-domain-containing protein [Paraphoma chrysanthemicola]|uniref:Heterokaryon incompatibility protein-domain-containing protein n=1 Tax=Paraphoma chrysanthemicola TaxID=798071 RepID=A0A8K0RGR0_9PLEO|nr:heterokaryon incompatibility protein-domain-containing protein [Paraphoma chrysanthemicola]
MVYCYEPVTVDPLELRLITIDRMVREGDPVSVTLRHIPLSSSPRYFALSYTWDRPTFDFPGLFPAEWDEESSTVTTLVNGKEFKMRRNLHSALYTFRQTWKADALWWIDAICINQKDIRERNLMVWHMTEIYAKSQGTVVWLGLPDGTTHSAFLKIAEISDSWESRSEKLKQLHIAQEDANEYQRILEKEFAGQAWPWFWDSLHHIFTRSWWERAWVLQELCVAPAAVLVSGECIMPWSRVMKARLTIVQHCMSTRRIEIPEKENIPEIMMKLLTSTEPAWSMELCIRRFLNRRASGKYPSLLSNLIHLRRTLSKDPRDKVYAAFGISEPNERTEVDYSLPVRDVYAAIARRCIGVLGALNILAYCKFPPSVDELPSWVPDWSDRSAINRIALLKKGDDYVAELTHRFYAAAGDSKLNIEFQDGGLALVVKGFSVCEVAFVSSTLPSDKAESSSLGDDQSRQESKTSLTPVVHGYGWLREWAQSHESVGDADFRWIHCQDWHVQTDRSNQSFDEATYRPTNEPLTEAYLRTLCCDAIYLEDDKRYARIGQFTDDELRIVLSKVWSIPNSLVERLGGRVLGISKIGLLALVPAEARIGDLICVVEGSELPLILRRSNNAFYLIGECYVHGMMDGQIWNVCSERSEFKII